MLPRPSTAIVVAAVACLASLPGTVAAQSLLYRSPLISGNWVARTGTIQFNFLHRFTRSGAPERKVSNFPTFLIGVGLPHRSMVGFHYATNSQLAPRYPNEWEFFVRNLVLSEEAGAPLDLGGEVAYNLAAEGADGEVSVGKRLGPVSTSVAARVLSNPFVSGETRFALAGGLAIRLTRHLALAGDVGSLFNRDSVRGEKVAWSAGLHIAIPSTPHTLSLQATNTNTSTLQGASRGSSQKRYGFEFTIPFTLARYFGSRPKPAAPPTAPAAAPDTTHPPTVAVPDTGGKAAAPAPSGAKTAATIRGLAFNPGRIQISAGGTVTWKNEDEVAHTVTSPDGSLSSPLIEPGASWSHTFSTPGTFAYFCTPHPFMKGSVEVK